MKSTGNSKEAVKVLILAIHGPYEPWTSILLEGQLQTWMKNTGDVRVINVFGKKIHSRYLTLDQKLYFLRWNHFPIIAYTSLLIEALIKKFFNLYRLRPRVKRLSNSELGDIWEIQLPDSLLLQGVKTMSALRESLNLDFDYLVTTISSSYINCQQLSKVLATVPRLAFLGGRIEISGKKKYQQGSFRVYSRDVVEFLVSNASKYKHWQIEDIAMGNLARMGFQQFSEIPNITVESLEQCSQLDLSLVRNVCSIRCKSISESGKRLDAEIMRRIHNLLETA